jgi:hypothetical protein
MTIFVEDKITEKSFVPEKWIPCERLKNKIGLVKRKETKMMIREKKNYYVIEKSNRELEKEKITR